VLGDNISIKPGQMDLATMLRKARAGTFPHCYGGAWGELCGQRAFRLESAEAIVNSALNEGRACTAEECRRIDTLLAEAAEIGPVINELEERRRKDIGVGAPVTGGPGWF
jgi:hypothetical protein